MGTRRTDLWQIGLRVCAEAEEPAAALLERVLGGSPVVYVDIETGERLVSSYERTTLSSVCRRQLREGLDSLRRMDLAVDPATLFCSRVRQKDWAHAWKYHFRPIRIGGMLILRPSWRRVARRPGQRVITLDPGLAFGTGHHPTTAFCLEQIVGRWRASQRRESFLDVGTGSGILPIAAAKLGFGPIEAFDVELDSVEIAQANARRNRVRHKIRFFQQDLRTFPARSGKGFDVVCANLVSELLCQQRHRLAGQVAGGGFLVLAGILVHQFAEVEAAYGGLGFRRLQASQSGEWKSGTFSRES